MDRDDAPSSGQRGGLVASAQRLLGSLLEIVQTRIELLANEYEEEREYLRQLLLYGMITLFFFSFGVMLLTAFMILLLWDSLGPMAVGGLAAAYLLAGTIALIILLARARHRPRIFSATVGELRKDREQVREPQ